MPQPKSETDVYIGNFLNNRYLIKSLIGKGGMGRVYLAEDLAKGRIEVAVKILVVSLGSEKISQRFAREIFIGAQLGRKSKNIVRVLGYGMTDDKTPFYVMEYLQGKNLKKILTVEPLGIKRFLYISYQICLGLQQAHQGISFKGKTYPILHRDIKPENIFITEDVKQGEIVRILDFGIAKFLTERSGVTLTDSFIGSLPYCSPEHMEGSKSLDVRSDIYSLGILMFEMLTGKHPFQTLSHSFGTWYHTHHFQKPLGFEEVNPEVIIPLELQQLVLSCLAKKRSDRPENINKILATFKQVQLKIIHSQTPENRKIIENSSAVKLVPVISSEKECWKKTWPKHQPIAPIAFPHLLHSKEGILPTFWAMLPKAEIAQLIQKKHRTELIGKMDIYPMLLWVTVLFDNQSSLIRWLSFFLDMRDNRGKKIIQALADTGYYYLLFFAMEEPDRCAHVMTLNLTDSQRQQLTDWLMLKPKAYELISSTQAKNMLKAEYKKFKLRILKNIGATTPEEKNPWKTWASHLLCQFMQNFSHRQKH
ncbi:serine/threonine-protein kinase [Nodularia harveyana UHCC-0300]|uniref:non-specific serine/threonine protein kinase n=1 Tax=Nodularia harveyana UHCC-0300 TaxID=2974287 RepID=A0ABU5U9Q7_9CYAN|nr:serine/threonine-protein kinase [Nodularia harveyana]MEA5579924.1 serine/threonine-protein kinase [Nodularia harveyana UHCC-0300]